MSDKQIRFHDANYETMFTIPDGGNVVLTHADGDQSVLKCLYINEYHLHMGDNVYHIDELVEIALRDGFTLAPETKPEIVQGYHILRRMFARDMVMVMGHNPKAPLPWVTWQGFRSEPGDYSFGHYYSQRKHANIDLVNRALAERHGKPYESYKPPEPKERRVPE